MSDFIKQLHYEIEAQKTICQNPQLYIQHKNISLVKFGKKARYIKEDDLPIETLLGSSYLIKGKNILETYAWCDNAHSLHLQISIKRPMWLGKIYIINTEKNDPENVEYLLDGFDIFHSSSNLQYCIINFIQSGFSLYIKNPI